MYVLCIQISLKAHKNIESVQDGGENSKKKRKREIELNFSKAYAKSYKICLSWEMSRSNSETVLQYFLGRQTRAKEMQHLLFRP